VVQTCQSGRELLHAASRWQRRVRAVLATAGAELDVPLLKQAWSIALALCSCAPSSPSSPRASARSCSDPRWSGSGAGPAWSRKPDWRSAWYRGRGRVSGIGTQFRSLVIAAVAINEMIAPCCSSSPWIEPASPRAEPAARPSLPPPAPCIDAFGRGGKRGGFSDQDSWWADCGRRRSKV